MKLRLFFIIMLILVVGCSQQFVCSDGTVVDDPASCVKEKAEVPEVEEKEEAVEEITETIEEEKAEEPEETVEANEIDETVQDFIIDANKRVTSMKFLYVGPPDFMPQDNYYIMDDKIKVELLKATDHKLSQPYTHVYLDNNEKTAIAYCEITEIGRCDLKQDDSWELTWGDYYIMSPLEWINSLDSASYEGGGPTFENRKTHRVRFKMNEYSGIMNVLDFYFIPALIILDDSDEKVEFRDLEVNTLKEKDMLHNPPYPTS